jgi:predicted transcriptional regulator of viral defense system
MSFHGLWEQEAVTIIVTARKVRPGVRKVFGQNVWVRRISPRHFFGYDCLTSGDFLLPVSDVEKTLIDMVYFREMRGDIAEGFREKVNREKLEKYLKKYEKNFRKKVVEFLR